MDAAPILHPVKMIHSRISRGPPRISRQRVVNGDHYRGKPAYQMLDHIPDWMEPVEVWDHNDDGTPEPEGYARPSKHLRRRIRAELEAKAKRRSFLKDFRKSKVSQAVSLIIKTRKRRMQAQRRRRGRSKNTRVAGKKTGGVRERALAELKDKANSVASRLQRYAEQHDPHTCLALRNDHSCLALPSEPDRLSLLVRGLAQGKHHYDMAVRGLQRNLEGKERQLVNLKGQMKGRDEDSNAEITALASQLQQQQQANELLRKQLEETQEKLKASSNTVLFLSTSMHQQKTQTERLTAALSARVLSRAPRKWLRFFTGFSSYARFQAFLSFLQSGDGDMLAKSCPSKAEADAEERNGDGEGGGGEEENGERNGGAEEENGEEGGVTNNGVIHQEKDSTPAAEHVDRSFCTDYSETEEEHQEATARSVRQRLQAELCSSNSATRVSFNRNLGQEDQLLLTLTRLRLGLLVQDLAFRFNVASATVSRIWVNWLGLMQRRLQQVPVRCKQHYIRQFRPQHPMYLGPGRELAVLECSDLLFDAPSSRLSRSKKTLSQPYRSLKPQRGCALASPEGHLGFCSSERLQELEDWGASPEGPTPDARPMLPAYLVGDETGKVPVPLEGTPCLEVLSVRSLADKVQTFRFLRSIQSQAQGSSVQMDRAWEVCCYLTCILYRPMGLR